MSPTPDPGNGLARLRVVAPESARDAWDLCEGESVVIGRGARAGWQVRHPDLSREHARFSWREGRVCVEDLGSLNGVAVAGRRIAPGLPVPIEARAQVGPLTVLVEPACVAAALAAAAAQAGDDETAYQPPSPAAPAAARYHPDTGRAGPDDDTVELAPWRTSPRDRARRLLRAHPAVAAAAAAALAALIVAFLSAGGTAGRASPAARAAHPPADAPRRADSPPGPAPEASPPPPPPDLAALDTPALVRRAAIDLHEGRAARASAACRLARERGEPDPALARLERVARRRARESPP